MNIQHNILFVGGTGAGKSSTMNALTNRNVAIVGDSPDPETYSFNRHYYKDEIYIWDSPGLGDSSSKDALYIKQMKDLLPMMDFVILVIDGSVRDLGTARKVLKVLQESNSIFFVILNQADRAQKGQYWNYTIHKPQYELIRFLDKKCKDIEERLGVEVSLYYSASEKYNLDKIDKLIINCCDYKNNYKILANRIRIKIEDEFEIKITSPDERILSQFSDTLCYVELVAFIEEEFDIRIPYQYQYFHYGGLIYSQVRTFKDLYNYVYNNLQD